MLRHGAPTRRASAIFCARDFLALRASKEIIYSVLAPPARARTNPPLGLWSIFTTLLELILSEISDKNQ